MLLRNVPGLTDPTHFHVPSSSIAHSLPLRDSPNAVFCLQLSGKLLEVLNQVYFVSASLNVWHSESIVVVVSSLGPSIVPGTQHTVSNCLLNAYEMNGIVG